MLMMDRSPGLSVRLKLTLSYAGFLMLAGTLLLAIVWVFLLRGYPASSLVPRLSNFPRVLNPTNFGPSVFGAAAVVVLTFLLVFGLVGGWLLAGRMLAPLEQQRFAANASHELRTPLAITQTLLDVARKDQARGADELVERLHAVNTRAIDLTEALLLLSRTDQRSFVPEHADLSLIAEEATETLLPLAEQRGVALEISGDVSPTIGSPALLLQMTTNLVHNAIVHNLPEHGTVWVTTCVRPGGVTLTIENTGDKLTPQLVATLTEPFQRGSKRIRTDHGGVGLGLAIVKSIAQAHDGTLTLAPRPAGGLRATVQFPTAPPDPSDDRQGNGAHVRDDTQQAGTTP